MKKILIFALLATVTFSNGSAQKHDYVWLMGYASNTQDSTFGGITMDFNKPLYPSIEYEFREMDFFVTDASICDENGNLLFATNGIYIADRNGNAMPNGDGLNPGEVAAGFPRGYNITQGALILPLPRNSTKYSIFHLANRFDDQLGIVTEKLYETKVDMTLNGGFGDVTDKNIPWVEHDLCYGQLSAVKHANGRDWWILMPESSTNCYYTLLFTPSGVVSVDKQCIGHWMNFRDWAGGAVFSPDGAKYARYDATNDVNIFNFDRCSGLLSNPSHIPLYDAGDTLAQSGGGQFRIIQDFFTFHRLQRYTNLIYTHQTLHHQWK